MSDVSDLKAENAKLRQLVRDMYEFRHGDCTSCRYSDECDTVRDQSRGWECIAPKRIDSRVHELGIEVDG